MMEEHDEEISGDMPLLEVLEGEASEGPVAQRRFQAGVSSRQVGGLLVFAGVAGLLGLASRSAFARDHSLATFKPRSTEEKYFAPDFEEELEDRRTRLLIEGDLGEFVRQGLEGTLAAKRPTKEPSCRGQAEKLYDGVLEHIGLSKELEKAENEAFKERFTAAMGQGCDSDPLLVTQDSEWLKFAAYTLEEQKPMATKALMNSINAQGYSFVAEMQDWMMHESKEAFHHRLGRQLELPSDAVVSTPTVNRGAEHLPASFDSAEQWPQCRDEIMRIHNQGHCGSCWAFSCMQVLDARVCISSQGNFDGPDATLAAGYFASCAAEEGFPGDGCQGGWEYYCYVYMDRDGTPGGVSETCDPYFGTGNGIHHFTHRSTAPECPSSCQGDYERTLAEDGFKLPGIGQYSLYIEPDAAAHLLAKQAIYEGGTINYGIYANVHFMMYRRGVYHLCNRWSANHAVVAFGWFPGGYLSKNSWGTHWGDGGFFKVADCIVTDFTVPGSFSRNESHIPYPLGNLQR